MNDEDRDFLLSHADWAGLPDGTPEQILEGLIDMLNSDKRTAEIAAGEVSRFGLTNSSVIPALIDNLDHDERAARAMRRALCSIGSEGLHQLVARLPNAKNWFHRCSILRAISEFGRDA